MAYADNEAVVNNFFNNHNDHTGVCRWRNSTKSLYCEPSDPRTLYSYGEHFMLAVEVDAPNGGKCFLKNGDRSSSTTNRHQWAVQRARPSDPTISFGALAATLRELGHGGWGPRDSIHNVLRSGFLKVIDFTQDLRQTLVGNATVPTHHYSYLSDNSSGEPWLRPSPHGTFTRGQQVSQGSWLWNYHLLGATLLQLGSTHWLCTLDESQYCVIELPCAVEKVDEALDVLKPQPVREADPNTVRRQGEWFFVPAPIGEAERDFNAIWRKRTLSASTRQPMQPLPDPRPREQISNAHVCHHFTALDGTIWATGKVYHRTLRGRASGEHRTLDLGARWYRVYRNTSPRAITRGGRGVSFD